MGGFLSRARRREDKEETSPRLKSEAEAKPDQNEYVGRDSGHRHSAELIFLFSFDLQD